MGGYVTHLRRILGRMGNMRLWLALTILTISCERQPCQADGLGKRFDTSTRPVIQPGSALVTFMAVLGRDAYSGTISRPMWSSWAGMITLLGDRRRSRRVRCDEIVTPTSIMSLTDSDC